MFPCGLLASCLRPARPQFAEPISRGSGCIRACFLARLSGLGPWSCRGLELVVLLNCWPIQRVCMAYLDYNRCSELELLQQWYEPSYAHIPLMAGPLLCRPLGKAGEEEVIHNRTCGLDFDFTETLCNPLAPCFCRNV